MTFTSTFILADILFVHPLLVVPGTSNLAGYSLLEDFKTSLVSSFIHSLRKRKTSFHSNFLQFTVPKQQEKDFLGVRPAMF